MKYFATLGPACNNIDVLRKMKEAGMDGIRLNLSHSTVEANSDLLLMLRDLGVNNLMIDIRGGQLRHQNKEDIILSENQQFSLDVPEEMVLAYKNSPLKNRLVFDDGKLKALIVGAEDKNKLLCLSLSNGILTKNKAIGCDLDVKLPLLCEEDIADLKLCKKYGINCIMLPFVNNRHDLLSIKETIKKFADVDFTYYGKIESLDGYRNLTEFYDLLDVVVIARGDLGSAMPLWKLPGVQKKIASLCRTADIKFMIVTQLLDSMIRQAVPTRAEVLDIYNAVLDGADYLMLTGETAIGQYPLEAMTYLIKTAQEAMDDKGH